MEIIARRARLRYVETLLAPLSGRPLNTARAGRLLGVSRTTAAALIYSLQGRGLARLVPFLDGTRKPLLYLARAPSADAPSFKGFCTEALARAFPDARLSWWKTGRVRQVDLVVGIGELRIGFCFHPTPAIQNRHWYPLSIAWHRGVIGRCFLLYRGDRASLVKRCVEVLPLGEFLRDPRAWVFEWGTPREAREARQRINELAVPASRALVS